MKIALLNLPYDNNYGGNLQRYALMRVIENMGHEVTHINLRFKRSLPWYKKPYYYLRRIVARMIGHRTLPIFEEEAWNRTYQESCKTTDVFYSKYIRHTEVVHSKKELIKAAEGYDCYIVGSDQVWRKKIALDWLSTLFLDFIDDKNAKRIAYGVSLGVDENELSSKEIVKLGSFYSKFDAVSVREDSALKLFEQYSWTKPKAVQVLDPTLLLTASDYEALIDASETHDCDGDMLCYILDETEEKNKIIHDIANKNNLKPYRMGLNNTNKPSVEQWLRSFRDATFVVTDSYHGYVFSIIFNKPVYLINNKYRGNARFSSLLTIKDEMSVWRRKSMNYLITNLAEA